MNSDLQQWRSRQPTTIRLGGEADVAYWTRELDVNEGALRGALAAVGPVEIDVRSFLLGARVRAVATA